MVLRRFIARLLALLVAAGLAVAPLANPAAAKASAAAEMTVPASMSESMPCCPDENSTGCQDCPLAAMCSLKVTPAAPSFANAIPMRPSSKTAHVMLDDVPSLGLNLPPLDHPPRNLV
jgi:hypothetical protein